MIKFVENDNKNGFVLDLSGMEVPDNEKALFKPTYNQVNNIINDLGVQVIDLTKTSIDIQLFRKVNDAWENITDILIDSYNKENVLVSDVIKRIKEVAKDLTI